MQHTTFWRSRFRIRIKKTRTTKIGTLRLSQSSSKLSELFGERANVRWTCEQSFTGSFTKTILREIRLRFASYRKWELKKKKSQSSLSNITSVPVGSSPRSSFFISIQIPVQVWYVALHLRDRRGAALLRYRNHPQITVITCEEKSNPVWF